jgi:hypothetical protein
MPSALIGARRLIHIPTADLWLKEKLGIKETTSESNNQQKMRELPTAPPGNAAK